MRKISYVLVFVSFFSCMKEETKNVSEDLKIEVNQKDTLESKIENPENKILSTDWKDDLIVDYIKNSEKDLIKIHFKNKDKLQWILDSTEKNDSTLFYIYNIGVDVAEEDGSEPRFSSCGWVYLDSVKRKLYEYDLPNEQLNEWKK